MEKELSKQLMCVSLRNGVELWLENDRVDTLKKILIADKGSKFIMLDNEVINTADIVGIFEAKTMEDVIRRRNGQININGKWYERGTRTCPFHKDNIIPPGKSCGMCH